MNKDLVDFLAHRRNTVKTELVLSREQAGVRAEYIIISEPEELLPLYNFWSAEKKSGKARRQSGRTGGKPAYVKIFPAVAGKSGLDLYDLGACVKLSLYLDWDTGYLVCGRGKRKRRMEYVELIKVLGLPADVAGAVVNKLKNAGVLVRDPEGWRLVRVAAKGVD